MFSLCEVSRLEIIFFLTKMVCSVQFLSIMEIRGKHFRQVLVCLWIHHSEFITLYLFWNMSLLGFQVTCKCEKAVPKRAMQNAEPHICFFNRIPAFLLSKCNLTKIAINSTEKNPNHSIQDQKWYKKTFHC